MFGKNNICLEVFAVLGGEDHVFAVSLENQFVVGICCFEGNILSIGIRICLGKPCICFF